MAYEFEWDSEKAESNAKTHGVTFDEASTVFGDPLSMNGDVMKKKGRNTRKLTDRNTMRPSYDFSRAVRGVTAARYAQGANVVVVDPRVLDVFPDGAAVNEALRALAPVLRQQRRPVIKRRRSA